MKMKTLTVELSAGIAVALLSVGVNNGFATTATYIPNATEGYSAASPFQHVAWEEAKREKLRHAYVLLEHTNGDYHGHKMEAMHSLKKAAAILGFELNGHQHEGEAQWDSDHRVREAKHILEDLADETHGDEQAHLHHAIKELDKAMEIH